MAQARVFYATPSGRPQHGTVDLRARETTAAHAPVAARLRVRTCWGEDEERLWRSHAGALWEPLTLYCADNRFRDEAQQPGSHGFCRALSDWAHRHIKLTAREGQIMKDLNPVRPSERAYKRGPDLTGLPEAEAFRLLGDNLLFVDGKLHQRSLGPRLLVAPFRVEDASTGEVVESPERLVTMGITLHRSHRMEGCFPHAAADHVRAMLRDLDLAVAPSRLGHKAVSLEVMIPAALTTDRFDGLALLATAYEALAGIGHVRLNDAEPAVIRHMIALRRALSAHAEINRVPRLNRHNEAYWLLPHDATHLEPLITAFQEPRLLEALAPDARTVVRLTMRRLGLDPTLQLDEQFLTGLHP